jgi:hypothetical protein
VNPLVPCVPDADARLPSVTGAWLPGLIAVEFQ